MEFRAGRALGTAFSVFFKNIISLTILGVVVMSPSFLHTLGYLDPGEHEGLWSLIGRGLGFFLQATVVYIVFQQLRGEHAGIGKALSVGLSRLLPVIGVVLLLFLALLGAALPGAAIMMATGSPIVGAVTLGIPLLIIYIIFYVAIPVAVVERPGVMMSLRRSQELTEGNRWGIFGLLLVTVVLAALVVYFLTTAMIDRMATGGSIQALLFVSVAVELLFSLFGAVVVAVVYHDLRLEKDGVSVDELASVFE